MTTTTTTTEAAEQLATNLLAAGDNGLPIVVKEATTAELKAAARWLAEQRGISVPTGNASKAEWLARFAAVQATNPEPTTDAQAEPSKARRADRSSRARIVRNHAEAKADPVARLAEVAEGHVAAAHTDAKAMAEAANQAIELGDAEQLATLLQGLTAADLAAACSKATLTEMAQVFGTRTSGSKRDVARAVALAAELGQRAQATTSSQLLQARRAAGERPFAGQAMRNQGTARSTGTTWQVWDGTHADTPAEVQAVAEASGERWVTWCATHGQGRSWASKKAQKANQSHPEAWCPTCQGA